MPGCVQLNERVIEEEIQMKLDLVEPRRGGPVRRPPKGFADYDLPKPQGPAYGV